MKVALALLAAGVVVVLAIPFGYVRSLIALAMFAGIVTIGYKYWRDVGLAPPEPELQDVRDYGLKYVCSMCGLELRVEVAAKDRPPTHCMEPMELVRVGGKPPLRPVD